MSRSGFFLASLTFFALTLTADDVPAWLREFTKGPIPSYGPNVRAVVLLHDTRVAVDPDGRNVKTVRKVFRTLAEFGWSDARPSEAYVAGSSKVREIHGWVILPSGKGVKLGTDAIFDRTPFTENSDLYVDVRVRGINCPQTPAGSIFGYESVTEDRPVFSQFDWPFQDRLPALTSRYVLTLPAGWRASGVVSNVATSMPEAHGPNYMWELRDLPYIEPEPHTVPLASLVPRVAVSYFPPSGNVGVTQSFASWVDVSRWLTNLGEAQFQPTEEVAAKARELAANSKTDFQKIQAIGRYVQGIRYVSIQTGLGQGGGYRPHPAGDVFRHLYGDCKDKATLLRAMLKAVGIDSYLVSLRASDRQYVREEFVSPEQFDHAIVAVKVGADVQAPAILEQPGLGRLLFVDATATTPAVGRIPVDEQGGLVLINAGAAGALIRLPISPPDRSLQTLTATLSEDGHLAGNTMNGRPWTYSFPGTSQLHGGKLLMFKPPAPAFGTQQFSFTTSTRKYPVQLNPASYREILRVKVPSGFVVDELPDPQKLEAPFGSYSGTCTFTGGEIVFTRSMELHLATVPVAQYGALKEFFERIAAFEQTPVPLTRHAQ